MVYGNNSYATEDYLKGSKPINVVPSYATIDEMAYYVIESSEQDFNDIMMETGIAELQHFEATGEELVTEAQSFSDKAEKWLKDTWGKVQGMIQQATNAINKKADSFRETIMKNVKQEKVKEKLANINAKKDFGSSYDFKGLKDKNDDKYLDSLNKLRDEIWKFYDGAKTKVKDGSDGSYTTATLENNINKALKDCTSALGSSESSTSSVSKAVKDALRGNIKDWKGSDVTSNYQEIYNEVLSFPSTKRTLKQNYDKLKKQFNQDIKDVKRARDSKDSDTVFAKALKGIKSSKSLAVAVEQAIISVLNERYNFYRTIIIRVVGTKKAKNESATLSSTSDTVESLFNW